MSRYSNRNTSSLSLVLIAALIWLPRAIGEDSTSRPATSQPAATSNATTSQPSDLGNELREGRRIIEETAAVYKNCKSYRDEGETVRADDLYHDGNLRIQSMSFKTAFVRPGRCRFEYREYHDAGVGPVLAEVAKGVQFIVWANDRDIRYWCRNPLQEEKLDTVVRGFAITAWFSGGNPYVIPAMLMPDQLGDLSFAKYVNPRFAGHEKLSGRMCNVLEFEGSTLNFTRIWIDADTKLICKVFEKNRFPAWPTERTTTYKPKINADIPAADLEFNAPEK